MTNRAKYFGFGVLIIAVVALVPALGRAQDTDGDGMPNSFENAHSCLLPGTPDADVDYDLDGLTSLQEYEYFMVNPNETSLDPCDPDTDADGVDDGTEYYAGSDPAWDQVTPALAWVGGMDRRITHTEPFAEYPSITWDGSEFGLAWDEPNPSLVFHSFMTVLNGDGDTANPNQQVGASEYTSSLTEIAGTGAEFGIVWQQDGASYPEIYFNRSDLTGNTLGTEIAVSDSGGKGAYSPRIVWSGSEFAAFWQDFRDANMEIYFRRIAPDGSFISPETRLTNNFAFSMEPAVAWTGSEYGVVWRDSRDGNYEIYFTRVSAGGTASGVESRVTHNPAEEQNVEITWTGSEYGLVWDLGYYSQIEFERLAQDGSAIGPAQVLTALDTAAAPAIAWNGSEFGVVWEDNRDVSYEVYLQRIAADGNTIGIGEPISPTSDAGDAYSCDIIATTTGLYGITFADTRNDGVDAIYIAIVGYDSDGDDLPDDAEAAYGTSASDYDTDNDGLPDGFEVYIYGTSPTLADTDGDGLDDGNEVKIYLTDPFNTDTDGDLMPDDYEVANTCLDPVTADGAGDADFDGADNLTEYTQGWDPCDSDSDNDTHLDGSDCGPLDPNNWVSCGSCLDQDGDLWFAGCDAYVTINGPDCDDNVSTGPGCHDTCSDFYADTDADLHGNPLSSVSRCTAPAGYVADNTDCSDANQNAWDTCATCNDDDSDTYYELCNQYIGINGPDCNDASAAHWSDCGSCVDADGDNYGTSCNLGGDCDDNLDTGAGCHAGCSDFYADADLDTYGDLSVVASSRCTAPFGYVADNTDCNDGEATVYPLAPELCGDSLDNQCPGDPGYGTVDEGCGPVDTDGDGISDDDEINVYSTDPNLRDTDGDGINDYIEAVAVACLDPLDNDTDGDGALDGAEDGNTNGVVDPGESDPCNPDTDGDGLTDGSEVHTWGTLATNWDTDGDYIPDLYEANHEGDSPAFDPLNPADGNSSFESGDNQDHNPNYQEYWNGSDPWTFDPTPNPLFPGSPGCYYWGEGDGDGYAEFGDRVVLFNQILGIPQSYDKVLPRGVPDAQDLDADGFIQFGDLTIVKNFVLETPVAGVNSRAASLQKVYEPAGDVLVGGTAHVTVRVRNESVSNNLYESAFTVLFSIDAASTGSAVLLGGDGSYGAGTRYDVSGLNGAADGGHANIAMKITGAGSIVINAVIPHCGTVGVGKYVNNITLSPAFTLNAVNPP